MECTLGEIVSAVRLERHLKYVAEEPQSYHLICAVNIMFYLFVKHLLCSGCATQADRAIVSVQPDGLSGWPVE